ncbi:MAG TPA: hypothetical protein VGI14_19685 [Casimicrobiaceae bacterium]|jgi:hypothetical protein
MLVVCPGLLAHASACATHPSLARLAYYAGTPTVDADGIAMLACRTLGLGANPPVAALVAAGLGVDPRDDYWLVADPVTLVPGRSDVALAGRAAGLTDEETHELLMALNAHFVDDGLTFVAPRRDVWLAHLALAPELRTSSLDRARVSPLSEALPLGDDASQWRRWQDEIQMLLHNHPVNGAREGAGIAPANAVWFWGGGRRADAADRLQPLDVNAPENALGDLLRGIAASAQRNATPGATPQRAFVHEPVEAPDDVDTLVERVLEPALAVLERDAQATLDFIADGAGAAVAWHARAPSALRRVMARWRARPLQVPQVEP